VTEAQTSPSNWAIESSTHAATPVVEPVPVIYTRSDRPLPLSVVQRAVSVIVALGCLGILVTAAWLKPDPNGLGTHQQLGFAACAFKERTGLPCPSCGYTTAFSLFAHAHPLLSFYTQPMGATLALGTAMAVWIGFYIAVTGRPVHRLLRLVPSGYYLMPLLALALLAWGWKVALVLAHHPK
jgi:hypothetical protein